MKFGRWACAGLLLVAFAAASVAAQQNEAEFELDVAGSAGRQLLREAEPYDDKKVSCRKAKNGKKICIATCYKRICRKVGKKVLCRKAKVSCKKPAAKKVEDNHKPHGAGHTRKLQSDEDAEVEVMEPETGRQLLREAEPYDDKKVTCRKSKGKKICKATCYKRVCRKAGKKVLCRKAKVSCKKPTKKRVTAKKATAKRVTGAPTYHADDKGGKCGGKGCADGAGHTRKLMGKGKPYDDKKVHCTKSKAKKVCRTECRKKVCYRSKSKKLACSMKACNCKDGRLIVYKPKKAPTKVYKAPTKVYKAPTKPHAVYHKSPPMPRMVHKKPPVAPYKTGAPTHDAYDDHGGKNKGGSDD